MIYQGKELSEHALPDLEIFWLDLLAAGNKREKASKHEKFNIDRTSGNKLIRKMEFPQPNPKFLELKLAIEEEIRKKKENE